jgi:N-acetyl-anhydromuramyl-L-alanine amidase AmpD
MNIIIPTYKWNGTLTFTNRPTKIILHHAAMHGTVVDIHRVHQGKTWAGIGYHYYIRQDGTIYKGRPDNAVGAHCPGCNTNSIGICAEGNFETETMPDVQKQAIIDLCKELIAKYPVIKEISPHKKYISTACPGKNYPLNDIVVETMKKALPPLDKQFRVYGAKLKGNGITEQYAIDKSKQLVAEGYDHVYYITDKGVKVEVK